MTFIVNLREILHQIPAYFNFVVGECARFIKAYGFHFTGQQ